MRKKYIIIVLLIIVGLAAAWQRWEFGSSKPNYTFQGYGEGSYVYLSPAIAGRLDKLQVSRGQEVHIDQPIAFLENANELAMANEAKERRAKAQSQYENIAKSKRPEEIDVTKSRLREAEVDLKLFKATIDRQKKLVETNSASRDALDRATAQYDRGLARIEELKASLKVDQLAGRPDDIKAAEREVNATNSLLDQANWKLDQKTIRSPVTGLVTDTLYQQGEWVAAGSPIVSILPPNHRFVKFFVPEPALGKLSLGQLTRISCNGCPQPIEAKISFISPTAEYTPPVIYSREWRSKLVFRIEATPITPTSHIHPGQPIDVEVIIP